MLYNPNEIRSFRLFILYLTGGIVAGFMAGLLGIGGGILFTPILFYIFTTAGVAHPVQWTVGSSMLCIFTASLSSIYRHRRQKNLHVAGGFKVGIAGVAGTFLGIQITSSSFYNQRVFVVFFCVLMLFSSFMFFWNSRHDLSIHRERERENLDLIPALITGGLGGVIATLAGVGGGIIMVPLMILLFHVNIHKTASISSFAISMITGVACLQYALLQDPSAGISPITLGYVDVGTAFPLAVGGIGGATLGARLNPRFSRRVLQWIFAFLALFVTVKLVYSNFF